MPIRSSPLRDWLGEKLGAGDIDIIRHGGTGTNEAGQPIDLGPETLEYKPKKSGLAALFGTGANELAQKYNLAFTTGQVEAENARRRQEAAEFLRDQLSKLPIPVADRESLKAAMATFVPEIQKTELAGLGARRQAAARSSAENLTGEQVANATRLSDVEAAKAIAERKSGLAKSGLETLPFEASTNLLKAKTGLAGASVEEEGALDQALLDQRVKKALGEAQETLAGFHKRFPGGISELRPGTTTAGITASGIPQVLARTAITPTPQERLMATALGRNINAEFPSTALEIPGVGSITKDLPTNQSPPSSMPTGMGIGAGKVTPRPVPSLNSAPNTFPAPIATTPIATPTGQTFGPPISARPITSEAPTSGLQSQVGKFGVLAKPALNTSLDILNELLNSTDPFAKWLLKGIVNEEPTKTAR